MEKQPKNRKALITLLTVSVGILICVNIGLSATLADAGNRMVDLDKQEAVLNTTIDNLERQAAHSLALKDLKSEASGLGFTTQVSYLELPEPPSLAYNINPNN